MATGHSTVLQVCDSYSLKFSGKREYLRLRGNVWYTSFFSGTAGTIEHYGDAACIIFHDGRVLWIPPAQFIGLCELDFHLWPFDTQICTLTFGSWTYHGEQINLQLRESEDIV